MSDTRTTSAPRQRKLDFRSHSNELADRAQAAWHHLTTTNGDQRATALRAVAQRLCQDTANIVAANNIDLAAAREGDLSEAMVDRLKLDPDRIEKMAQSVAQIAAQNDPIGQVIFGQVRPNGLKLQKVRVPIGVILIIYESRPNVTSDAAALCLKSANAVILRGGKESMHTNTAIAQIIRSCLEEAAFNPDTVQLVQTTDRRAIPPLLKMEGKINLVIPRGGESLIRTVVEQAQIPVIKHYTGNCHIYVDAECDDAMAQRICLNAKVQRPSVCNAVETLIFHRTAAQRGVLATICQAMTKNGVQIRADQATQMFYPAAAAACEEDWSMEYLDLICAVRIVDNIEEAIAHINLYGSKHTDAIVTTCLTSADLFVAQVDSANVFVNCSTRFSDGGEYGLGAEIGISTDKLHARGPMGADDLTTYKWVAHGTGQLRK